MDIIEQAMIEAMTSPENYTRAKSPIKKNTVSSDGRVFDAMKAQKKETLSQEEKQLFEDTPQVKIFRGHFVDIEESKI